ncbi:MAG TPA: GNAT family N-acetyltransferase [Vicinamibacterales bacterium]|nr:GNAT family N-acetyltransferase [Vicinamibacterales bacterium]
MSGIGPETIVATPRLTLRCVASEDAAFVRTLLNEPSFLRHIGDKGVRTLDDARTYIAEGPQASYARFGFGLYIVELNGSRVPIGLCGLLKRDELEDVDLGFAFLPAYWSQGYAAEAARAVLDHARAALRISRIVAIVSPANDASIRLLGRLGFTYERMVRLREANAELQLFASMAPTAK